MRRHTPATLLPRLRGGPSPASSWPEHNALPHQLMPNLIFSLTPEDYSTSHCARLRLSLGSPAGSAGTAWLWDVVLKSFRLLTVATTSPAPRKQIFARSRLCEPRRHSKQIKRMAPQRDSNLQPLRAVVELSNRADQHWPVTCGPADVSSDLRPKTSLTRRCGAAAR